MFMFFRPFSPISVIVRMHLTAFRSANTVTQRPLRSSPPPCLPAQHPCPPPRAAAQPASPRSSPVFLPVQQSRQPACTAASPAIRVAAPVRAPCEQQPHPPPRSASPPALDYRAASPPPSPSSSPDSLPAQQPEPRRCPGLPGLASSRSLLASQPRQPTRTASPPLRQRTPPPAAVPPASPRRSPAAVRLPA